MPVVVRQSPVGIAILASLALLTIVAVGWLALRLFAGGETGVGIAVGILGLAVAVLPLLDTVYKRLATLARRIKLPGWAGSALIYFAAIVVVLLAGSPIIKTLADNQFTQAVNAPTQPEARIKYLNAVALDPNVADRLQAALLNALSSPSGEDGDRQTALIAGLIAEAGRSTQSVENPIIDQTTAWIAAGDARTIRGAGTLAMISPITAATHASRWNDAGVTASQQDQWLQARWYSLATTTIDEKLTTERTPQEKSIALINLAYVYEIDAGADNAIVAYRNAIAIWPENIEARYQLASLFLVFNSTDPDAMQEALQIAKQGRTYLPPPCGEVTTGTAISALGDDAPWYCFLLLTTEAGARLALNDDPINIAPLLDRAIALAERQQQFGVDRYTAEAYYDRSRLPDKANDLPTLCQIIAEHNPANERHRRWASAANVLIAGRTCPAPTRTG